MARISRRYLLMLSRRLEPQVYNEFVKAIDLIRSRTRINRIVEFLRAGRIHDAVEEVAISSDAFRNFIDQIEGSVVVGSTATADRLAVLPNRFTSQSRREFLSLFGRQNPLVQDWMRNHSAQLVTAITNDQRNMLRDVMFQGMLSNRDVRAIALDVVGRINPATGRREGGVIGLTQPQAQFMLNARKQLEELDPRYFKRELRDKRFDSTIRKAIASGVPLSAAEIDRILNSYNNRLLKHRGQSIARTETFGSLHAGQRIAFLMGIDFGILNPEELRKTWRTVQDARVRDAHVFINGDEVGWDERFGNGLLHPHEPGAPAEEVINCRCWLDVQVAV